MKLGIVCPGEKFASAAKAGFEYVEPPLAPLRALPGPELRKISEAAENAGVSIDGFCCFFEGHVKLYGPDRTPVLDSEPHIPSSGAALTGACRRE